MKSRIQWTTHSPDVELRARKSPGEKRKGYGTDEAQYSGIPILRNERGAGVRVSTLHVEVETETAIRKTWLKQINRRIHLEVVWKYL